MSAKEDWSTEIGWAALLVVAYMMVFAFGLGRLWQDASPPSVARCMHVVCAQYPVVMQADGGFVGCSR